MNAAALTDSTPVENEAAKSSESALTIDIHTNYNGPNDAVQNDLSFGSTYGSADKDDVVWRSLNKGNINLDTYNDDGENVANVLLEWFNGKPVLTVVNPETGKVFFLVDPFVLNLIQKHLQG